MTKELMKVFGTAYQRAWRKAHVAQCTQASYRWRAKNPDKARAINHRYERTERRLNQRQRRAESGEANCASVRYRHRIEGRYQTLQYTAKCRGLACDLPFEVYAGLVAMACEYCGKPTGLTAGTGLDRKDSSLGYTVANSVSCCMTCNRVKNNVLSYDEMRFVMARLNEYRQQRDR